jgi:hypothetical protein
MKLGTSMAFVTVGAVLLTAIVLQAYSTYANGTVVMRVRYLGSIGPRVVCALLVETAGVMRGWENCATMAKPWTAVAVIQCVWRLM